MLPAAVTPAAPPPDVIGAMTACAFALGTAASEIAKGAGDDTALFLAASAEFRHCFFAVRMGIRLKMALGAGLTPGAQRVLAEPERAEPGLPPEEREPLHDRLETEREREGDYEPVSLPQFLKTLGVAASAAEARRNDLPAEIRDTTLPRLHSLLGQANAPSDGAGVAVLARPAASPVSRSRLLGSVGILPPRGPPTLRRASG